MATPFIFVAALALLCAACVPASQTAGPLVSGCGPSPCGIRHVGLQPSDCKPGFHREGGMCVSPVIQVDGPTPYDVHHAHCPPGAKRTIRVSLSNGVTRTLFQRCVPESAFDP